jgi:hypothetical protein
MTAATPASCSLDGDGLVRRLQEVAAIGAEALIEHRVDGERHLLRFESDPSIRRRLEALVAAEGRCCSFLDLSLQEDGDRLVLALAAPAGGQPIADRLAAAFMAAAPIPSAAPPPPPASPPARCG